MATTIDTGTMTAMAVTPRGGLDFNNGGRYRDNRDARRLPKIPFPTFTGGLISDVA
jgi:hypothetical protein